jgi:hypothetical protein
MTFQELGLVEKAGHLWPESPHRCLLSGTLKNAKPGTGWRGSGRKAHEKDVEQIAT